MLFKNTPKEYDRENMTPALHKSICTGETVAGFIDNRTGKFKDILLIRNEKDLKSFLKNYNVDKSNLKSDFWFFCNKSLYNFYKKIKKSFDFYC